MVLLLTLSDTCGNGSKKLCNFLGAIGHRPTAWKLGTLLRE